MTNYEMIHSLSKTELAEFFAELSNGDEVWDEWFNQTRCQKCGPVIGEDGEKYAWCEVNGGCKFTPNKVEAEPRVVISMWFDQESGL